MTPLEAAEEILSTLKLRYRMYCITREAVLCRATTVLDMLGVNYSASTTYADLSGARGSLVNVEFLKGEPGQDWVNQVVDVCLALIPRE